MDELQSTSHALAQELYRQTSGQQGPGEAAGAKAETSSDTNKENDNVVDADYKVVDDDQK